MKKFVVSMLTLVMLVTLLAIPAMAADGGTAAVSTATGASGGIANVTVSLAGFEQATGVVVSYSGVPTLVNESSSWLLPGMLSDIGTTIENYCVWGANDPTGINGDVLKLALRLPAYDGTKAYTVSVSIKVKANDKVLGELTAYGTVNVSNPATEVTLSQSALALDLSGTKTATLTAQAGPASTTDTVVWSSSDSAVATVTDGLVEAKKVGTATITATAGNVSKSCTVTVTCGHANAVNTPAKNPTCEATGNNSYWTCGDCGKILAADKTTETTVAAQTLATISHSGGTATCKDQAVCGMCGNPYGEKKAHTFATAWSTSATQHWHICTACNAEKSGLAAHSFQWKVDKAATEDAAGLKHEECACGYKRNENTAIPKLDHVHVNITRHAAVPATCIKAGTLEYWTCGNTGKCGGKYYGDAACQVELSTIVEPINANNHAGKTELRGKVEPTCAKAGYSGDTYCLDCGVMSKKGAEVAATGKHTAKADYLKDETNHWQECSVCNAVIGDKKDAHNFAWVVDKYPTEYAEGLKHEVCSVCKQERSKDTVMAKLVHNPVLVDGVEPTCVEEGVLAHYHCASCGGYYAVADGKVGNAIKKEDIVLPAKGHSFGAEWKSDEKGHWHVCACGEASDVEAHTAELVGVVEATQEQEGYSGDSVCSACQFEVSKGQVIPVVGAEPTETQAPAEETPTEPAAPAESAPNGSAAIIAVVAVVGLGAIGGGLFWFFKKRK